MFTVEIKASQPWQLQRKLLDANSWTIVATARTRIDAEKDIAWFTHDIQSNSFYLKKFKVEYRIRSNGKTIWRKEEKSA